MLFFTCVAKVVSENDSCWREIYKGESVVACYYSSKIEVNFESGCKQTVDNRFQNPKLAQDRGLQKFSHANITLVSHAWNCWETSEFSSCISAKILHCLRAKVFSNIMLRVSPARRCKNGFLYL